MKKTFWLLDVNYEVKDHQPEMWLWGIYKEGKRPLFIYRNFLPYFYFVVEDRENPQLVMEKICPVSRIDIEYYKQVVPAASRILSLFDVTKDELQPSETPSLSKFMKS